MARGFMLRAFFVAWVGMCLMNEIVKQWRRVIFLPPLLV